MEGEGGEADGRDQRASASSHETKVYRRPVIRPAEPGPADRIKSETTVAVAQKPRYVDLANPSLSVECPNCGLRTARFVDHCRNCGYKIWPSSEKASPALKAWRDADPSRAAASRFDLDLPPPPIDDTVDYAVSVPTLGIYLFSNSNYLFIISVGLPFLALRA